MDSVNEVDVLTANIDYVAKGRELRSRQQQQMPAAVAPGVNVAGAQQAGVGSPPPAGPPSAADANPSAGAAAQTPASLGAKVKRSVFLPTSARPQS